MTEPLASIIIDNYNYGRFLATAIDSALAQTYPSTEVIVVDDGSLDNSREVIASYGERVKAVFKPNGGQTSALNTGFAVSHGEVVIFLDADDVLLDSAVASAVAVLLENPDVVNVHWRMWEIDADGQRSGLLRPAGELQEGNLRDRVLAHGPAVYYGSPQSANAWPRRFLTPIMPIPEPHDRFSVPYLADGYLQTLAMLTGELRIISTPQGLYRIHSTNAHAELDFSARLARDNALHNQCCTVLANRAAKLGLDTDPARWKSGHWDNILADAIADIRQAIPTGEPFAFADGDESGLAPHNGLLPVPFPEREGQWLGHPESDLRATAELERLLGSTIRWLVIAWPVFWWLEYYERFAQRLAVETTRVLLNDRVLVFRLEPNAE